MCKFCLKTIHDIFYRTDDADKYAKGFSIDAPLLMDVSSMLQPFPFFCGMKSQDNKRTNTLFPKDMCALFNHISIPVTSRHIRGEKAESRCKQCYNLIKKEKIGLLEELAENSRILYDNKIKREYVENVIEDYKNIFNEEFSNHMTKDIIDAVFSYIGYDIHKAVSVMVIHGFIGSEPFKKPLPLIWEVLFDSPTEDPNTKDSSIGNANYDTANDDIGVKLVTPGKKSCPETLAEDSKLKGSYMDNVDSSSSVSFPDIRYFTYYDLKQQFCMSPHDIAEQLVSNDNEIYGTQTNTGKKMLDPEIEGDIPLWASHIQATPDFWGFLCDVSCTDSYIPKIVGNFSFAAMNDSQEKQVLLGDKFRADIFRGKLYRILSDQQSIMLLNISVNDSFQTLTNYTILWEKFFEAINNIAKNTNVFIKNIYFNALLKDDFGMVETLGFRRVPSCRYELFKLDLTEPFTTQLFNLAGDLFHTYSTQFDPIQVEYVKMDSSHIPSESTLRAISKYVWETDQYIYPPLLTTEQAQEVLPLLFRSRQDSVFNLDNIYAAIYRGQVVGILLYKTGPLKWNPRFFKKACQICNIPISSHVEMVADEYFSCYDNVNTDVTSILNVCIDTLWRRRGIGTGLMRFFMEEHPGDLELYVLHETPHALRLYIEVGFDILDAQECNGFSIDHRVLPCLKLTRPAIGKE